MTKITDKGRNQLLATVGTAMAASMMVTSAHAADTVVTPAGLPTVTTSVQGHDVVDAVLANVDDILSQIDGVSGGVDQTVSPGGTSTIVVDENIVRAAALGNNFDNSIDLSIIGNDVDGDGAAALGFEYNDGAITATATNVDIFANLDDFTGGAVGVDSNSVKAEATGNAGSTSLAGSIPNTYVTSAPSGVSHFDSAGTPELLNASGSLVASTVQMNADVDIDSYVEADIYLDLVSTGDQSVAGSPEVIGNTSAATSKGNSSNSTIDIQSGGAPTFEGSAVVSNGQSNVGVAGQDSHIEAENYTYIYGDIGAEAGFTNTLTGSLLVQNNSISASASGNEALGATTGAAGNRILLADGMSFQGATDNSASTDIVYTSGTVDSNVAADLVINNSQGNVGAANGDRLEVYGYNDESEIYGEAQELVGGSIDVSGNSITASARGNAASSALSSGEGAATFAGTVAVANQQTNLYTDVLAEVYDSYIWGWAGDDLDNLLTDSTISVDDNRFAASAYGNQVSQNVTLDANTLDFGSGALVLTGGTGPDGNLSSDGGVIVSNLQSLYSSNVTADEESYIEIGTYSALIDNSTLQATGNTQEAVALGNTGSNGLSISGTTVDSNAGINSVQIVADASAISAVSNSEVDLESLQVNGSTVEMSGNLNRAIAYGASVSNNLAVDANEIILSDNDIGSTVTFNPIALDGFVLDNTNAPTVLAPYGVLNIQSVSASISAQASSDTPFELDIDQSLGGEDEGSTAINDSNTLVAAAYGTDSFNRASLTANTVDTPSEPLPEGGEYSAVMNLTNAQTVTNNSIISAEASGSRIVETDITLGAGNVIESTSSASSNNVQALAYGNLADNGVSGSATTLDTEASFFGLGSRGAAVVTNGVTLADASFGLNNVQSAGGVISAALLDTVNQEDAALVLTAVGNDVVASSIISDDNSLAASATGNRATNAIALDGNELATTSALVNFQNSGANITTAIGLAGTDAVAPTSGGTYPTSGLTGNATGGSSLNGLGILTVPTGETVTLSWSLTGAAETDLEAYLTTLGFSVNAGANTATGGPDTYDMSAFFGGNLAVGGALSFT
ncbi:MAG TPA: hypothetical protein VL094_05095, partial [Sphingomonadaceae bacterium]|nr:hypothetical protein [Sphingomonadaceae bacterium]